MKSFTACIAVLAALCSNGAWAQAAPDDALYQALGARDGIGQLMTDFVGRLKIDPRIGRFFEETNPKYLADQLSDQVCQVSGGPCQLDGPNMKLAHESLQITKADFNALVEVLQQAMDERGIGFRTQNQLLARLAPMHRDIINTP